MRFYLLLEHEKQAIHKVIPGPGDWILQSCLFALPELFKVHDKFPVVKVQAAAVKARRAYSQRSRVLLERLQKSISCFHTRMRCCGTNRAVADFHNCSSDVSHDACFAQSSYCY